MFGSLFAQLGRFGQPRSREQITQHHSASLKDIKEFLATGPKHHLHFSNHRLAKPAGFGKPPPCASCSPILCSELQLDAVHKGHVLSGTLVVDALLMSSVQTVLEDEAGDVVQVFMYNTPQLWRCTPAASPADISTAQQVFPKGQRIAILEPYYKVMADGTLGVRVDNPAEVIFLDASGCPVEPQPQTNAGSSNRSSSASGSSSSAASMPKKPQRPNKKKGKGRKK